MFGIERHWPKGKGLSKEDPLGLEKKEIKVKNSFKEEKKDPDFLSMGEEKELKSFNDLDKSKM